jgi:hypothetical protein
MSFSGRRDLVVALFQVDAETDKNRTELRNEGFKKKNKIYSGNPNDIWKVDYMRNVSKLTIMIMLYAFYEYDGEFTKNELKMIKTYYKKHRYLLDHKDLAEIIHAAESNMNIERFKRYMEEQDFKESIFLDAIKESYSITKKHRDYQLIVSQLEQKISI